MQLQRRVADPWLGRSLARWSAASAQPLCSDSFISVIMMMADLSSWTVYPYPLCGSLLQNGRHMRLGLNFWPMVSRKSTRSAHTRTHSQPHEDAVRTSWARVAFVGPLTLQAGGRPGPWTPYRADLLLRWWSALVNIISQLIFHFS